MGERHASQSPLNIGAFLPEKMKKQTETTVETVSIPSEYRGIPTKDSKVKFIFPTTETSQSPLNIGAFLQNKTSAPVLGARPLSQSPLNIGAFLRHVSH